MPQYQYQGFSASGKNIRGFVTADNVNAAKAQLKRDGFYPSQIQEVLLSHSHQKGGSSSLKSLFARVSIDDLANMTRQLATLVGSHIPLVEALDALTDQVENPQLKAAVSRVRADVNEGNTLNKSLAKFPKIFSELYVNMVASGEASGALDIVLLRLADFLEYQARLKKKVMGALIYPFLMICFGAAAVLIIFTFVIPQLQSVFESNKQTLPLNTQIVLWLSQMTLAYWWALLLFVIGGFIAVNRFLNSEYGRRKWHKAQLELPIFGDLFRMMAVSRFTKTLSTLLRSGIPLLTSLNVVRNVVENITIREAIQQASTNLTEGQGISGPLKRSGQFPPLVTHMVSVGEKTGELETMLEKVAHHYEYQVESKVQNFTALIEPVMIISLAIIVLFIVLSVIMPMLELNNAI